MTWMVKEQVVEFPEVSSTRQVTVEFPTAKKDPLAGVQEDVATPQLSETVGAAQETLAPQLPESEETVTFGEQVIVGAVVSGRMVTFCAQVAVWPPLVAVQVTMTEYGAAPE